MKRIQKMALCLGLLAVLTLPVAGCSGTWQGIKNDWHGMTGSNDDQQSNDTASAQTTTSTASAQDAGQQAQGWDTNSTSAYNK